MYQKEEAYIMCPVCEGMGEWEDDDEDTGGAGRMIKCFKCNGEGVIPESQGEFYEPPTFEEAMDSAFKALREHVFADAFAATIFGTSNIKRRVRKALNWSADVDWNLRRILALREAGEIGPEATCWALTAAARKSPETPAGERDSRMVDVQWSYKRQQVSMPSNPINGHFRVTPDSIIVAVIDRRSHLTTDIV